MTCRTDFAQTDNDFSNLTEIFTCKLCNEIFNEPITLVCSHTFCQDCLETIDSLKCPTCNVKIWIPPNINTTIRDAVREIYGNEQYQESKHLRQQSKQTKQTNNDISKNLFQSIMETINIPTNINVNEQICQKFNSCMGCDETEHCEKIHKLDNDLLFKELKRIGKHCKAAIPNIGEDVCPDFSTIVGCKKGKLCENAHILHVPTMAKEIMKVREKYGFLFPEGNVCKAFSTVEGCEKGELCSKVHVPHMPTLLETLYRIRKSKKFPSFDTCIGALIGGLFMLVMARLVS